MIKFSLCVMLFLQWLYNKDNLLSDSKMEDVPTKLLGAATLSKDVSEQRTLTGSVGFFSILGKRLSSKFRANRLYKNFNS